MGRVSIEAAVLASLQTFLQFSERAEKHCAVAARYGAVLCHIEQMQATQSAGEEEIIAFINDTRQNIDRLAEEAPGVSGFVFRRAKMYMGRAKELSQK